jgi:NAD+ synthase (glutamine-hydrolysing)
VTPTLRIALAQVNLTVGAIAANRRKIAAWIARARRAGADIVAFPELSVSGYPAEDLLLRREFLEDCRLAVEALAKDARGIVAVVGFPHFLAGVRNSAAVLAEGRLAGAFAKIHLPNYGVFDEKRYFTPGREAGVLRMGGVKIGVSICEDIWYEDVARAQAGPGGADVLLNISCSPYHAGKGCEREELMRQRALANGAFVAYLNLVGGQDELVFDGHSVVIGPGGDVVARGKQFCEDLVIADIDCARAARRRPKRVAPEEAIEVAALDVGIAPRPKKRPVRARVARPMDTLEEIYAAITTGTRDYVHKNGFRQAVIGLSGGIDSALVAAVAVDALGADSVIGVSMPSRYSSRGSVTHARQLARNLGIKFMTIGIEDAFKAYLRTLRRPFVGLAANSAEENLQARIRGNILMALSNKFGWLVLTTGNKSEFAMGYCTLYGDLAGGFAILKDVPKTLVYELAAYRNALGKPVIPEAVFTKPPSAELRPNQKDEDTLPPYAVLDPVLEMYVVGEMTVEEIVAAGYNRALVRRIAQSVDGNEYKRRQGPPGVKITPKAFGKDRRMPLTNRYR